MLNSALSETSIFKYTEFMGSSNINTLIKKLLDEKNGARFMTEEDMEDIFYKMRHKSFNFSAKFAVIDLFRKGIIRLVYNDKEKLTVAIPFFKYKMPNGGYGTIVNISNYAKVSKDGSVSIDPLTLYCLMLSAAFSLSSQDNLLAYNGLPELYASLFVTVVARLSNLDLVKKDKIRFVSTKFMYMQLGLDEKRASNAAVHEIKNLDNYAIEQIDLAFPSTVFKTLESLVEHMRKVFTEFENITFGSLFEKWMRSFGECSAFSIEYVPSLVNTFNALITNSNNLVNVKAIEKEANRNSKKLIMLFNRIETVVIDMSRK